MGEVALGRALPVARRHRDEWRKSPPPAKALPSNIERHVFDDVRITAYRLAA